jgi:hypothetical protein
MPRRASFRIIAKDRVAVLLMLAALLLAHGCATYHVRTPTSDPLTEHYQRETMHAYLWGLAYDPQVLMARCAARAQALDDVRVQRTLPHDLASVLTFGLWMPITLEYRCKAPAGDVGPFPEAPSRRP